MLSYLRSIVIPKYAVGTIFGLAMLLSAERSYAQITRSSGGLAITISKITLAGSNIGIQLNARNTTKGRVYLRDASGDQTQVAILGSTQQPLDPSIVGIELCVDSVARCANPAVEQEGNDLNRYSYIEPEAVLAFSFIYHAPSPASESDTITFNVALVARYSSPDGNSQEAGQRQQVRQNFSRVPLNLH